MPNRTLAGRGAHLINTCLASAGLTVSRLPERNTLERLVRSLLQRFAVDLVLDVGAHHGEFGQMVRGLGYAGSIVSFEPSSAAFAELERASHRDRLWQIHRSCLGDEDGTVDMQCFHETVLNSLHPPSDYAHDRFGVEIKLVGTETVPIRRLDTLLPEIGLDLARRRTFLKIDTQGHDLKVVAGAADVLSHIDVIQTELSTLRLYRDSPRFEEAICLYREHGFTPVGFYPVNVDQNEVTVVEWDCIFARAAADHLVIG